TTAATPCSPLLPAGNDLRVAGQSDPSPRKSRLEDHACTTLPHARGFTLPRQWTSSRHFGSTTRVAACARCGEPLGRKRGALALSRANATRRRARTSTRVVICDGGSAIPRERRHHHSRSALRTNAARSSCGPRASILHTCDPFGGSTQ